MPGRFISYNDMFEFTRDLESIKAKIASLPARPDRGRHSRSEQGFNGLIRREGALGDPVEAFQGLDLRALSTRIPGFLFQPLAGNMLPDFNRRSRNMADASDGSAAAGFGRRIALARKAAWLSQREVAERLGIPRRTYAYYESHAGDLPSSLLVPLADVLGVGVYELLGIEEPGPRRPGPQGYLQERLEALKEMPRDDQRFVVKFLDQVLEDYGRRRRKGRDTEGEP